MEHFSRNSFGDRLMRFGLYLCCCLQGLLRGYSGKNHGAPISDAEKNRRARRRADWKGENGWEVVALASVMAASMLVSGGFYVRSHERLGLCKPVGRRDGAVDAACVARAVHSRRMGYRISRSWCVLRIRRFRATTAC